MAPLEGTTDRGQAYPHSHSGTVTARSYMLQRAHCMTGGGCPGLMGLEVYSIDFKVSFAAGFEFCRSAACVSFQFCVI